MSDELHNPTPTENSISASPQEPTEPTPENTEHSDPANVPPEAPETPTNVDIPVSLKDYN